MDCCPADITPSPSSMPGCDSRVSTSVESWLQFAGLTYKALRRALAIRHVSGHRLVGIVEIVSPSNKDRSSSVAELAEKVESAIRNGIHVLLIDLFVPGKHDPQGIHGSAWAYFDTEKYDLPVERPLSLVSYLAGQIPEAYIEHLREHLILQSETPDSGRSLVPATGFLLNNDQTDGKVSSLDVRMLSRFGSAGFAHLRGCR